MKPLTLFHTHSCLVPFPRGAVADPASAVRRALDGAVCFPCAKEHGLLSEDERYGDAVAAVHRTDPGGGGAASMMASLWRNVLCSRCGFVLAQCDLDERLRRSLLPEGWSPERTTDRILRIDDRDAYRAVGRMVRRTLAGEIDAETYERAARLATDGGLPGVEGRRDVWAEAALDDRLRAVAWAQGLEEVHLPHLVAVQAASGSDLAQQLTAVARHADETGAFTDYRKASANGSYLAANGWHILLRASMPEGIAPESVRPVAWRTNAWLVGDRMAKQAGSRPAP